MEKILSNFGESFIENVRDNSLFIFESILSGRMKDVESREIYNKFNNLSEEERTLIKQIAYKMVDLTIHNVMFFFEQDIDDWKISNSRKQVEDLANLSDGLTGELYSEDGWIKQFSKYRSSL